MNSDNAIEIRNMYKSFRSENDRAKTLKDMIIRHNKSSHERHIVLKNINMDIKKGETVALIGTNGSGKSTLLKLMTKIIYPDSGTIETDGKLTSLLELGAGFHPDFTGRENIYFNAAIFGLNEKQINERIDDIISFSELGDFIDQPIRTYSSGMYMRLAFSVAINVDADILLIDEILAVGDQHFQEKCYAKLKELRDSEKTIIIVSHSMDVVKDLCHRAVWIYKGEFRLDGDPVYVIDEYLKQVAMDNRDEKKKAVASGKEKYKATIFVDSPKDFESIRLDEEVTIRGWHLNDCENGDFIIKVGTTEIDGVSFMPRKDVMEVYAEQYGGFVDENKVGFAFSFKPRKYINEIISDKILKITFQERDDKNNLLNEKSLILNIDGVEK